jgi:protein disulfide-isomerase-like protein
MAFTIFGLKVKATPALMVLIALVAMAIASTYLKEGFESAGKTLVLYYAPWCGHCKALKPEWEKLEKAGVKGVTVRKVDADESPEEIKEAGVDGFPTIIFYNNGKKELYSGERTAGAISKWAASL